MVKNHQRLFSQKEILKELYAKNNYESSVIKCNRMEICAVYSLRIFRAISTLYLLCAIVFNIWPMLQYVWSKEIYAPLPGRIPFVDYDTRRGFIILYAFQSIMNIMAALGIAFADSMFAIFTLNILTFSGLFAIQSKQLNEMLLNSKQKIGCIRIKFRNVILMHQEASTYVRF